MKKFRILALDGGGIRGLISAIWLQEILVKVGRPAHECFDLIVGTSTGAITGATAALGMDLGSVVELYQKNGPRIFPPTTRQARRYSPAALFRPIYDARRLHRVLAEHFQDRTMASAMTKLMIPAYRTFDRRIELVRSYSERDSTLPPQQDWPVWEACKSSSAAPTYFAAHVPRGQLGMERALIDGGMFANNPALLGTAEAVRMLPGSSLFDISKTHDIVLVSLGTGRLVKRLSNRKVQNWGMIGWVRPSIDILMDASSEVSAFCSMQILPDEGYVRMQCDLIGANDDMDDASLTNLTNLASLAQTHLKSLEGQQQIERILVLVDTAMPLSPAWRNDF